MAAISCGSSFHKIMESKNQSFEATIKKLIYWVFWGLFGGFFIFSP
jgi:hypothetical protein